MSQFGNIYSQYYDLIYKDKNYSGEVDYVIKLIRENKIRILIFDNNDQDIDVIYDNEIHTNIKNITNEIYKRYNATRKKCN